jgi:branched-chain amino acid transport system ATP-binding protein
MLLEVRGLQAGYGRKSVIHDVSLAVGEREIVAVLGHNGAGKSTLMSAIFGILAPTKGRVMFRGADVTGGRPSVKLQAGIGYAPQGAEVFKALTVTENLMMGGFALADQSRIEEKIDRVQALFPALHARRNAKAGSLSGGERQMLSLGMLLVASPKLLILDEPSGGLSPLMLETMYSGIENIARQLDASVLLVEQDTKHALAIAGRAYVMAAGRITFAGSAHELETSDRLAELLVGA